MSNLQLVPGTLAAPNTCWQPLYDEMFAKGYAVGPSVVGLLIQDEVPDAEQHDQGWIPTSGGVPIYPGYVFVWNVEFGHWMSRNPIAPSDPMRRIWVGDAGDIDTYDGGEAGTPMIASGPMWEIDTLFAGRVPIGVGAIPTSNPAASIEAPLLTEDSNGSSGAYQVTLTEEQGAIADHVHPIGVSSASESGTDFLFPVVNPPVTTPAWTGAFVGGDDPLTHAETTANMYTLGPGDGQPVTTQAHKNAQPFIGVYFIKRTIREWIIAA